jgi:hypothetical protein
VCELDEEAECTCCYTDLERTAQQLYFNRLVQKTDNKSYKALMEKLGTEEGAIGELSTGHNSTEPAQTEKATLQQLREEGLKLRGEQWADWQMQRASTNGTGGASQHETAESVGKPETASTMPGSWTSATARPG